jgi:Zn-finger nucleic acid-binding protein
MMVIEYKKIELDFCNSCRGVWFDGGELELLLEDAGLKHVKQNLGDVLLLPEALTDEKKRRCPICSQNMKKVRIGGDKGVMIDACVRHDGLWFDGGEVADLIKIIAAKTPGKKETDGEIIGFLKEVFPVR